MKVLVCGVRAQSGKSKAGNDYDMKQLVVLSQIEGVARDNLSIRGAGFEEGRIDLTDEGFNNFISANHTYPQLLDCITDTEFRQGRAVTVVTGFNQK